MKLRMDRVLKGEISGSMADVTASKGPAPTFPKPASWTAPYAKYTAGAPMLRAALRRRGRTCQRGADRQPPRAGWWSMFEAPKA
jgi:hypothetical protein